MLHDYHTHSNYSDGTFLWLMAEAAEASGLDGIGFADHCNVSQRSDMVQRKHENGFNLDTTFQRRRDGIHSLRKEFDVTIFDAVEIDYHPQDEDDIQTFLDEAQFDYVVGSVHFIEGVNVHTVAPFAEASTSERQAAVDTYFDMLVAMIESNLIDIAAHMDVIERNTALRGLADEHHYNRVADALKDADTVPEINAGRLLADYGDTHPAPQFLDILLEEGVRFTFGTDSHRPEELRKRLPALQDVFDRNDITPVTIMS